MRIKAFDFLLFTRHQPLTTAFKEKQNEPKPYRKNRLGDGRGARDTGAEIATTLAAEGATVVINYRSSKG